MQKSKLQIDKPAVSHNSIEDILLRDKFAGLLICNLLFCILLSEYFSDLANSVNVEDITSLLRNDHVLTQREGFDDDLEEFVISEDEDDDL